MLIKIKKGRKRWLKLKNEYTVLTNFLAYTDMMSSYLIIFNEYLYFHTLFCQWPE